MVSRPAGMDIAAGRGWAATYQDIEPRLQSFATYAIEHPRLLAAIFLYLAFVAAFARHATKTVFNRQPPLSLPVNCPAAQMGRVGCALSHCIPHSQEYAAACETSPRSLLQGRERSQQRMRSAAGFDHRRFLVLESDVVHDGRLGWAPRTRSVGTACVH